LDLPGGFGELARQIFARIFTKLNQLIGCERYRNRVKGPIAILGNSDHLDRKLTRGRTHHEIAKPLSGAIKGVIASVLSRRRLNRAVVVAAATRHNEWDFQRLSL